MPPEGKPQPSQEESRPSPAGSTRRSPRSIARARPTRPGDDPRLNRAEYNNTIRDLVGVDFHPADDFPSDDVGYGFDNNGDVLTLPPILFEKYLDAAEKIADAGDRDAGRLAKGPVKT